MLRISVSGKDPGAAYQRCTAFYGFCQRLIRLLSVFWLTGLTCWSVSAAPLSIVTTTSDLKNLAEAVGGPLVTVTSLTPPGINAEIFQPRPQDLQRLQAAALVVRVGLDFDLWLDGLLAKAGRPELMRGGDAHVNASNGIALLEVRSASLDAAGHGHGAGNPHYWLDPRNAEIICASILDGLRRVDPTNADAYTGNYTRYIAELRRKQAEWQERLAPLAGKPVLAYHDSWAYLARRFRLRIVDIIEPKPGIAPSPSRLAGFVNQIAQEKVAAILKQSFDAGAVPDLLARKTGVKVITLASSVGAPLEAGDYVSMIDYNVAALAALRPTDP